MAGYVIAAETCYLLPVIRVTRSTGLKTIDCFNRYEDPSRRIVGQSWQ